MKPVLLLSIATAAFAAAFITAAPASAHGVIAIGRPASIAQQGLAIGYSWNFPTSADATADAMKQCSTFKDAPDSTRALCKTNADFTGKCLAIAMDPRPGTEGFGWAVAVKQIDASTTALQDCKRIDGADNADACVVQVEQCDTIN